MTDTTILPNVPAYVQLDRNHGGHYNRGISDKDRMHLTSDFFSTALRDLDVAVERTGRSTELAVEKLGAANQLAVEKTAAATQLASKLDFANTQNLLISGFKDGRYDAAVNTAAVQATLAECCCEIKELVREDGGKTRELIQAIDSARLAGQLTDAKNEITFLRLSASQGNGNGNGNGNN